MKKIIVAAALALAATTASATIAGSSHDLHANPNPALAGAIGGAACAYCHMPHNGGTLAGAPLWARRISSATASATTYVATYSFYSSVVGGHTPPTNADGIGAGSRACLSCHDGAEAIAVVFNANGTGTQDISTTKGGTKLTGNALIGTDLRNDHPVSVTYTNAGTNYAGLDTVANATSRGFSLPGGNVECISCHNAHNAAGLAASYSTRQFMVSYSGDFCAACHALK